MRTHKKNKPTFTMKEWKEELANRYLENMSIEMQEHIDRDHKKREPE